MAFDQKLIERMTPHVQKLVAHFEKKNVTFSGTDGEMENVVFRGNGNEVKIAYRVFYRWSGIAFITKAGTEKNSSEWVEVTDKLFYDSFMKQVVDVCLYPPTEEKNVPVEQKNEV